MTQTESKENFCASCVAAPIVVGAAAGGTLAMGKVKYIAIGLLILLALLALYCFMSRKKGRSGRKRKRR